MAFREVLSNAGVLDLSCVIHSDGKRYLAYSAYVESRVALLLGATDGVRVWSKDYDETGLQQCRESSALATLDVLLSEIVSAFRSSDVKLNILPQQANLVLAGGAEFELIESTVQSSRQKLQELVFLLALKLDSVGPELVAAKRKVSDLEQQCRDASAMPAAAASTSAMYEPELKKKNLGPKLKRQQGRSLLNPSSRKRKAASGVVFDED